MQAGMATHRNVYVLDESGFGSFQQRRLYGYSLRGMNPEVREPFFNCGNVSLLSTIGLDGVVLQHYFRGGVNGDMFKEYMEELVYALPPDCFLVMDNCSIHHKHEEYLVALFRMRRIEIIFLPPYSPDLSPIEIFFGRTKDEMQVNKDIYNTLDQRLPKNRAAVAKIKWATDSISKSCFANWYRHCGWNKV